MLTQLGAGDGGTHTVSTILGADFPCFADVLDVDDQVGVDHSGAQLHQQIRAATENAAVTGPVGEQRNGAFD